MITLIMLLSLISIAAMTLVYGVIRLSFWKNRALLVIIISALYFLSVFILFGYYEGVIG